MEKGGVGSHVLSQRQCQICTGQRVGPTLVRFLAGNLFSSLSVACVTAGIVRNRRAPFLYVLSNVKCFSNIDNHGLRRLYLGTITVALVPTWCRRFCPTQCISAD
jgi:hypothetical protein